MISDDTLLGPLLEAHPALVDVLAGYHAHFARLRDPKLRRVMAPRVTLAQAAGVAGIAPEELIAVIRRVVGESGPQVEAPGAEATPAVLPRPSAGPAPTPARPAELDALLPAARIDLDVREDIRRGQEPFARIMAATTALGERQVLVLRAPFEPIPLYDVLGKRGLAHWTEHRGADDWTVWFYRPERRPTVVDVRGLEPPGPMVLVLEALEGLQPGERLEVIHDRRPMLLYPLLDERGFVHATDEPEPGVVRIAVERRGGA